MTNGMPLAKQSLFCGQARRLQRVVCIVRSARLLPGWRRGDHACSRDQGGGVVWEAQADDEGARRRALPIVVVR